MLKLKLYLAASTLAAETLKANPHDLDEVVKQKFEAEGGDPRDFDYFKSRFEERRGAFQNLLASQTESEIAEANKPTKKG